MAVAALLLWMCTAAVGAYLLATSTRPGAAAPGETAPGGTASGEPALAGRVAVPQAVQPALAEPAQAPAADLAKPAPARDRFDPPSLAHAKSEPLPGMRALAEFAHPALAMIGFAFWLFYVVSRDRVFAAIGFGVLLGAIAAGLSWVTANRRAAKRAAAGQQAAADQHDAAGRHADALSVTPRVLALHAAGAALTLLIAALITARV